MSKSNLEDIITKKFILELNEVLAFENAGIERLATRIEEISIPEAKQQIQHHLKESLEHQKRLQQLITSMGGEPTQLKVELPLPSYPDIIRKMMENSMTKYEWELKKTEHDLIIENAEVSCYLMLIEKAQMTKGEFLKAAEPLSLNLKDEQNMVEWIKTNSPEMLAKLWPKIQSATVVDSSSSSSSSTNESQ
jgi:ferritin-like metal-binding protein YciE